MTEQEKKIIEEKEKEQYEEMMTAYRNRQQAEKNANAFQEKLDAAIMQDKQATTRWSLLYKLMEDLGLKERSGKDGQEKENTSTD